MEMPLRMRRKSQRRHRKHTDHSVGLTSVKREGREQSGWAKKRFRLFFQTLQTAVQFQKSF